MGARRLGVLGSLLVLVAATLAPPAPTASASASSLVSDLHLAREVKQLVTVTSRSWSSTTAAMRVWQRTTDGWRRVRGPVRVSVGWNGFVRAGQRRQGTGTTPAGRFAIRYAFGNRADPGTRMRYREVDRNDMWPYEPRDEATYNIYQPHRARTSRWRADYVERLADYGYEYAYSLVLGFNLPRGVHWSERRRQYVAREPADTRRGGGIFLHVRRRRSTAGCVSAPIDEVRRLVRRLDPAQRPRLVMGPGRWVRERF